MAFASSPMTSKASKGHKTHFFMHQFAPASRVTRGTELAQKSVKLAFSSLYWLFSIQKRITLPNENK